MTGPYRVEVLAKGETTWATNALQFDTMTEAENYGRDLASRWTLVQAWRVVPIIHTKRERFDPDDTSFPVVWTT